MSMQPQPLKVFPNALSIGDLIEGSRTTFHELISNPSQQPLLWHAETGETSWLTLDQTEGTLPPGELQAIDVSVDVSKLDVKNYNATVTFTSVPPEGSALPASVQVPVTLTVSLAPAVYVGVSAVPPPVPGRTPPPRKPTVGVGLNFDLSPNSSQTTSLAITNRYDKPTSWTASIESSTKVAGWLTLDRMDGFLNAHEVQTLYVRANASALKLGDYNATLNFFTVVSGTRVKIESVGVIVHVGLNCYGDDGPHCAHVDPQDRLDFNTQQLGTSTSLQVSNPDVKKVNFTVGNNGVSWLIPNPTKGFLDPNGHQQINLKVDTSGLQKPGTYKTDLTITFTFADVAGHGPTTLLVPVTVSV